MGKLLKIIMGFVALIGIVLLLAFYFTSGVAKIADDFFAVVTKKDYDSAYAMLSEEFKKNADQKQLVAFLEQNNLTSIADTTWNSREVSNNRGKVQGSVSTTTGGSVPLTISFIKNNGEWKIYSISKSASGLQGQVVTKQEMPSNEELIKLTQKTNAIFAEAVAKNDMNVFYQHISQFWKKQITPEKLEEIFKGFYQFGEKLSIINQHIPSFVQKPTIDADGVLHVSGNYPQLLPKKVTFTHKFIKEGMQWEVIGFKMNIE